MAASDARPVPRRNVAYRAYFPIVDADGDLVTGAASLDSEVSKDGGTFADCTNEATEVATSSGMYYLDLSATEMDADCVMVIVKTGTAGAKTTPIIFYPEEVGDFRADVVQISGDTTAADNLESYTDGTTPMPVNATQLSGDATAADNAEAFFDGTGYAGTNNVIPTVTTLTGHTAQTGDSYAVVNSGTHGNAALKTLIDAVDNFIDGEIADIQSRLPAALVSGRMDSSVGAMAAAVLTATAIAADAITAAKLADGAIDRATFAADTGLQNVRANTAQAGAAGAITLDASASATDDLYNDSVVYLTGGTGAGQARIISDYTGSSKVAAVVPNWATNPDNTSTFAILPAGRVNLALWLGVAPLALTSQLVQAQANQLGTQAKADVNTEADTALSDVGVTTTVTGRVDAAITTRASQTSLDTLDDFVDTEMAAVKAKTDNLPEGIAKNTALSNFEFFMVDSADHVSGKTGLTVTAERSIDGAAFGACANSPTEVGAGVYKINLADTDLNGTIVTLKFTATGADATVISIKTEAV